MKVYFFPQCFQILALVLPFTRGDMVSYQLVNIKIHFILYSKTCAHKCWHFFNMHIMMLIGTVWTASAHIVTAVIGSGVLSLAWSISKLGWIVGPSTLIIFAIITYFSSSLLADCYRTSDPNTLVTNGRKNGKRNYTYMDAVRSNLGKQVQCERMYK